MIASYCWVKILCQNILLQEAEAEMGYLFHSRRGWNAEREERRESRLHFSPVQAGDLYLPYDDGEKEEEEDAAAATTTTSVMMP